jgi:hypothetical protein
MWAACNGHATVVELLLDAKADTALCDQVRISFQGMLTKARIATLCGCLQGRKTAVDWAENAKIQDLITGHGESIHSCTPTQVPHTDVTPVTATKPKRKSLPALPRMKSPSSIAAFPSPVPEFGTAQSNDSPDAKLFAQEQPMMVPPMKATSSHGGLLEECDAFTAQFAHATDRREVMRRHDKLLACLRGALELTEGEDYERVRELGEQLETLEQESAQLPLSEGDYLTLTEKHASLLQRTTAMCKEYQRARNGIMLVELGTKREELKKLDISCCQFRPGKLHSERVNSTSAHPLHIARPSSSGSDSLNDAGRAPRRSKVRATPEPVYDIPAAGGQR